MNSFTCFLSLKEVVIELRNNMMSDEILCFFLKYYSRTSFPYFIYLACATEG